MPNSRRGLVLLLVAVVMSGGAAWATWHFERQALDTQAGADRLSRHYAALELTVADLRAAQAGYVAAGQGPDFWMTKVDELSTQLEQLLTERRRLAVADAQPPLGIALAQLQALGTSDSRARRYVGNDQRLLASDVVYVESLEILTRISTEITTAREIDWAASRQAAADVRLTQWAIAGGTVLFLIVLLGIGARPSGSPAIEAPLSVAPAPDVRPAVEPIVTQAPTPAPALTHLSDAADVCVDIARLLDGRDLPAILTRAAGALDAKGLVLWVIDDARETLRPTLAHGYSERTLQKLGTLSVTAENVTSVACRSLQPQRVPGAVAVPLIGASGCVGVLAAEISGPGNPASLPIARVIAAQLASVITPLPSASASGAQSAAL